MKPRPPNPRDAAIAWAQTFCEDWKECRDDSYFAPVKAWALLAAWGAVRRFFAEMPVDVAGVSELLQRDSIAILAALWQSPDPAEWLERARSLDGAWDFALREHELRELETRATVLFDELDRHGLALCMARRLDPGSENTELNRRIEQLSLAEEFFAQHVVSFLPTAHLAAAEIAAFRPDLEQADPELWLTTLKHRRLDQVRKETESFRSPQFLTERDKEAIQAKVAGVIG